MVAGTVPIKTPAGHDELSTRARRVSQRHRTVLFLVDGRRSTAEVRSLAQQAGVPDTCFDELLEMALIMLPEPTFSLLIDVPDEPEDRLHVDLPLSGFDRATVGTDSLLPASRTLYPTLSSDSIPADSPVPDSWLASDSGSLRSVEPSVAEARLILLRAVRAEAPLAGSLTLLRLRRARSRDDLTALLDEVEARITKPHRVLAASQTMRRVRHLLGLPVEPPLAPT